jgi:cyanophycinase-like exopeptidase
MTTNPEIMRKTLVLCYMLLQCLISQTSNAQGYLMLAGGGGETDGGWSDTPYRWVVDNARNKRIAVISYSLGTEWIPNYFKSLGAISSKNFYIPNYSVANSQSTYDSLITYDGVFIKGGDQSVYYENYLNSKTQQALQEIYNRGGVLSGTSAGMAILSPVAYTAQGATIYPASALANPYTSQITLKDDFLTTLAHPYIFDTHFVERGRLGRLTSFMANWFKQRKELAIGIGVDDRTALCIAPNGIGTAWGTAAANLYFPSEDALPFDTTQTMLRTGSMRTIQLIHGCSIDLNTLTINEFDQFIQPQLTHESGYLTILLSGSDQVSEQACNHLIHNEGTPADTIVIITGSTLNQANSLKAVLQSQGAINIFIAQALSINQNDNETGIIINSGKKFIFTGNEYDNLMSFCAGSANGTLLNNKIRSGNTVSFFVGDNARYAGKTVVNKYIGSGAASYNGLLEFDPGLALLKTTAIMPNTYLNADIYENTVSGLPYAMVRDSLSFGLYLTGNTFARYTFDQENKTFIECLGGTVPLMMLHNTGTFAGIADQGPGALSRNVAGFETMHLRFLSPGDTMRVGTMSPGSIHEADESGLNIYPNPARKVLNIQLKPGKYQISLSDLSGRMVFSEFTSGNTTIDLKNCGKGIYFLKIINDQNNRILVRKIVIN